LDYFAWRLATEKVTLVIKGARQGWEMCVFADTQRYGKGIIIDERGGYPQTITTTLDGE